MEPQQQEMKIIIASPSLNLLGGAQRACLHAINALRRTNYKIVLATIDKTDWALVEAIFGDASKPDEERYLFSRMPEMPIVALKQAFIALSYALYLSVITAENRTGLVINMGGELVDNLGDVVYVNAIPLRLTHFSRGIQPKPGIQWKVYSRLFSMFLRFLGDAAGVMVANSKFTQKVIRECLGKKALLINPPVEANKTLMRVNQGKRENVVITITRFRSAKGLEIIPEIASYFRDCEFIVVGIADKESKQCLKELSEKIEKLGVQKRVHIFRNKRYEFTLSALSTAKIYLHTQSTEAFGMSIVESMAAGCIPIVPRTGGPWIDILDCQEGQYGFSYRSSSEAAAKIKLLLDDESLRSKVSVRAIERSMVFDSSAFEKKLLNVVEAVLSRSKRGSC
jgi:glycosyltransferase involved in cell wall biosynthesis